MPSAALFLPFSSLTYRTLRRLLSGLLAALSKRWRVGGCLQLGHPFDETSQEASVLPQFLGADVELLLEVHHLVLQALNQCSTVYLSLTSSLRPATA